MEHAPFTEFLRWIDASTPVVLLWLIMEVQDLKKTFRNCFLTHNKIQTELHTELRDHVNNPLIHHVHPSA